MIVIEVKKKRSPMELIPTGRPTPEELMRMYSWVGLRAAAVGGIRELENLGYPTTKCQYRIWKEEHGHEEIEEEGLSQSWPDGDDEEDESDEDGLSPPLRKNDSCQRQVVNLRPMPNCGAEKDHPVLSNQFTAGVGRIDEKATGGERRVRKQMDRRSGSDSKTYRQVSIFE